MSSRTTPLTPPPPPPPLAAQVGAAGSGGPGVPTQQSGPGGDPIYGIAAFGTLIQVLSDAGPPEVYTTIENAGDISGPASAMGEVETTSHSTGAPIKTFAATLADTGEITFPCFWNPSAPTQSMSSPYGLEALFWARTNTKWQLIAPDPTHRTRQFRGFVKTIGETYPVQGVMTRNVSIRIMSKPVDVASPINLTPSTATPDAAGGVGTPIDVKAGGSVAPWLAGSDVTWITVDSPLVETIGDGTITYTVAANTSLPLTARTGHINVSGLGLIFTVTQGIT